jgi:hypothetical protein
LGGRLVVKIQSNKDKVFALKFLELTDDGSDILERFRREVQVWVTASSCDAVVEVWGTLRINETPDRGYFGRGGQEQDKIGFIDGNRQAVFGRGYAAEPDALVEELMVGNPARRYSSLSTIAGSTFIARRIGCQAARMPMAPTVSRAPAKDKGSNGLMP